MTHVHTASGKTTQTEVYTYVYDHLDRICSVTHKLNSNAAVTLASYTYDNKGRMATKKLHGSSSNQLTYAYNIRSWLTGITSSKFTQTLGYGSHYNGNISSMSCTANGNSHSYSFTYDGANRMLNATHGTGAYTEKVTEYDKNGNIKFLQRYNSGSLVDNLTYNYGGNQLTKVEDATGNSTGFTNGASTTNEYTYDANGNLTKDSNKGIASITYNSLNLPQVVTFSNGNTITYLYTADGRKLRTVHKIGTATTTTDYCGNVIYENGTQKLLLTEEGYIDLANSNTYYYYLKDHQGNNRVVINGSGTVMETNHYYPFGGTFASTSVQPYKYNGKELDTKNGLNWYDYGARHYDATIGRWHGVDPLSEKYYADSPYTYCGSNPVNRIDPTGMDWYKDNYGNLFWQEGHKNIDGYTNIGSIATIGWGEDIFFNYYQNMGILGDKPVDAIEQIASSPYLMQQAFSESSGLSDDSQVELFNAIQSRDKAELVQPIGMFVASELLGGVGGKAVGWLLGKVVGNAVTKGYESFAAFKKVYGPAGNGMAWHHIVEQNASNIAKFGAERIHNINNMVKLPHGKGSIHAKISGYYNSKIPGTNIRVRDYVNTLSYDEQYKYGIEILNKFGWKP